MCSEADTLRQLVEGNPVASSRIGLLGLLADVPPSVYSIVAVVVISSSSLLPVWAASWKIWAADPLRSIGILFPALSLLGVLGVWKRLHWTLAGTWWGLPLMLVAIAASSLFSANMLLVLLFGQRVRLLHPGMALFCYAVGAVLLFGGWPLLKKAIAPLCLLLLLDPVPHYFNRTLDMPLQMLSAGTARAFAHLIGLRPTGEQLQMMFAPNFGMFIVPGCNGVRGAVTLGYLALLISYVKGLPARVIAGITLCAVLMGYLLNLLRLCTLVLYYRVGLSVPSIQPYGTQIDYVIGVTLFLLATLGTGVGIAWYQLRHPQTPRAAGPLPVRTAPAPAVWRRAVPVMLVALLFFIPQARSVGTSFRPALSPAETLRKFPQTVGLYTLTHTWEERDGMGSLMFLFGDYVRQGTGERVTLGIYLASEEHYVFLSKLTQGVKPDFQGSFDARTASAQPVHYFLSFYREGGQRTMDAESACRLDSCGQDLSGQSGSVGIIHPHVADLLVTPAGRRIPLLIRMRSDQAAGQPAAADADLRTHFEQVVREFTGGLDLRPLLTSSN